MSGANNPENDAPVQEQHLQPRARQDRTKNLQRRTSSYRAEMWPYRERSSTPSLADMYARKRPFIRHRSAQYAFDKRGRPYAEYREKILERLGRLCRRGPKNMPERMYSRIIRELTTVPRTSDEE
jgi:hypothetical protein